MKKIWLVVFCLFLSSIAFFGLSAGVSAVLSDPWVISQENSEALADANRPPDYFIADNWKRYPHILSISLSEAYPGDKIYLSGINLDDPSITLTLGGSSVAFKKTATSTFEFIIPTGTSYGYQDVSFTKGGVVYQKSKNGIFIKKKGALTPTLSQVVSSSGSNPAINDTITIYGKGFASSNEIMTSLGNIKNVLSIGSTLSFSFGMIPNSTELFSALKGTSTEATYPVIISVRNENGWSANWGPIYIKL